MTCGGAQSGGAAGALALIAFYRALSRGAMAVVAPTTAVVSAVLPGRRRSGPRRAAERHGARSASSSPVLAVALVSGAIGTRHQHTRLATIVLAGRRRGIGFGFIFIAFARTADDSGMWPLVVARAASLPVVALVVGATRPGRRRAAFGDLAGRSPRASSTWPPTSSTSRQVIAGC